MRHAWPSSARWRVVAGVCAAAAGVAVVTGVIALLEAYVPVLSLAGLYIFVVLPTALVWGRAPALAVAVASILAFDFFLLPPVDSFAVTSSSGWSTLLVFAATAVVVSELAARSRRRAREAELLARTARSLLERGGPDGNLDAIATEAAQVLEARRARIVLGPPSTPAPGEVEQALVVGGRQVGQLFLEGMPRGSGVDRTRLLPALSSLLAVAIEHERLTEEAYRAEALRRSDEVKTAIIRAVSHDLRTPLATMETALGSLRDSSFALSGDDRRELLEAIGAEHARLKRLVENLLDLSRLQAGAAEPAPELWAVDQLVIDALEQVDAGERIEVEIVPERVPLVRVDAGQIERVLANLLENALKFSPPHATVRVRIDETRDEVMVRVVNQGSGIPLAELDRIFEPFQRLAGPRASGAGLGLAIAKGFAEANGGRVRAESKPGQGASFTLTLPVVEAATLVPA